MKYIKRKKRLKARQDDFEKIPIDRRKGFKKPGSLNK